MSSKFEGRIISAVTPTTSGTNYTGSASGVWEINASTYAKQAGTWPKGSVVPTRPTLGAIAVTSTASDPYFDYITLLLNFDDTGTPAFKDKSINNTGITPRGISAANTTTKKFGTGSLPLTVTTGLDVPGSVFTFGSTTDFTIEFWVYLNTRTGYSTICGQWLSPNTFNIMLNHLGTSGTIGIQYTDDQGNTAQADSGLPNTTIPLTTWTHVAFSRSGTTCKVFINGVGTALSSNPSIQPTTTNPVSVGNVASQYGFGVDGYIDDFRVTKGVCRYVNNFTPPTSAHPLSTGLNIVVPYEFSSDPGANDVTYTLDLSDGRQLTGTTSPFVTTISQNTVYSFSIKASNISGYGESHISSNIMRLGAPVPGTPVFGNTTVTVPFTRNDTNTSGLPTTYTVRANPGNFIATGTTSPITVPGLTNGTPYTFTITASNDYGISSTSATSSSMVPATVPSSPVIGTVSSANSSAVVPFTYPTNNNGDAISGYTVTSSPGNFTTNGTTTPITVTGLNPDLSYTFTVVANNKAGSSLPSSVSNSVRAAIVPATPTNIVATPAANSAVVTFTQPNNGGYAPTYIVTASPGGQTATGTATSLTVTGLNNNVAYTFTVTATTTMGTSSASVASNVCTPGLPLAPTLSTVTYSSGTTASVAFTAPSNNGGYAITGYTLTRSDGATVTGTTSPLVMANNFTDGVLYTFTVKATNSIGTGPVSNTSASGAPKITVNITYSSNATNVVISQSTITSAAVGWDGVAPIIANITNNATISSTSTSSYALSFTGIPSTTTVNFVNYGSIIGMGGNGGSSYTVGSNAGPALIASSAIRISNYGVIGGGGGGGGAGGSSTGLINWKGGGGGGGGGGAGGSGGTGGTGGTSANTPGGQGNSGSNGSMTSGGNGGQGGRGLGSPGAQYSQAGSAGANAYSYGSAGSGGPLGPASTGDNASWTTQGGGGGGGGALGSSGGSGGGGAAAGSRWYYNGPYAGGTGGAAIAGNSNITWIATGTRAGAIT